jgi:hypothetical protein
VENWHSENNAAEGVATANLWLEDTHAIIKNCWFYDTWDTNAVYPIYIHDSNTSYNNTNVTIKDCVFLNPMPTTDDLRQDSIYINQISTRGSVVHLRRNYRYHMKSSASWSLINKTGIVVKSGDSSLNTLLTSIDNQGILSSEVDILYDGAWKVGPPMSTRQLRKSSNAPSFIFLNTTGSYPSTLTSGQPYYYKIAFYNGTGWSAASSESSATPSGASLCVQFQPSAKNVWGILRVWRGTSTGVYTHYADVPMTDCAGPTLYDQGGSLCGFEWKTTPPTPPTADNTMDGYILTNGKRVFYGAAAPSSGEFTAVLGDIVWKTAPAANQTPGWMCTTAGSPGTWKAMANLAN